MTVFVTSDHHFGHENIIRFCKRPFKNDEEMTEVMIQKWNEVVPPDGVVHHLGDFSFRSLKELRPIFNRLNGTKHLIIGNHDNSEVRRLPWETVCEYRELRLPDRRTPVCLMHYPLASWNGMRYGAVMLHGHVHFGPYKSKEEIDGDGGLMRGRYDVGVDNNEFVPLTLYDAIQKAENVK